MSDKLFLGSAVAVLLLGFVVVPLAGGLHERDYQAKHCMAAGGAQEYRLPDATRVDCLTAEYAIEYDYAPKWPEAIGQALHYAMWTGRKAKIVLIAGPADARYVARARAVVRHYGLPVEVEVIDK